MVVTRSIRGTGIGITLGIVLLILVNALILRLRLTRQMHALKTLTPGLPPGIALFVYEPGMSDFQSKIGGAFAEGLKGITLAHEPHPKFKERVPFAIGLIRTGDTVPYANMILESA